MADTSFIKFLFREDWAPLKEVLTAYSGEYSQVHELTDEKMLARLMLESQPTLVLASVKSKEDITKIMAFLKSHKRLIKENSIKFSAVNFTYNRQVETALMKIGCQEVLDPGIKGKALKYKLDFWKKALSGGQTKATADSKVSVKEKGADAAAADAKADAVKWEEGLKCVDDMWLLRSTDHAKKILGKWLVKFMGPSPFVGQWTEAVPGKKGIWKYTFKEGIRDSFHKTAGHWFFLGDQKPEFIWKENLWMVTGSQFQLVFQNGEEKMARFTGQPGQLSVCKNSSFAKGREAAIVETFDQEVMVKKGIITDTATAVDTDNEVAGHYKGKTEGDEAIDHSPMEGKSSTDDLGGNLEGAVGEQDDAESGPLQGKSSTDTIDDTPEGKGSSDNVGATKYKGKLKFEKTDKKSDYGGASETDDLGPDHYSNKTETGAEHQKDKTNTLSKDPVHKGEMRGQLETDDLGPSHYSNQKKEAEAGAPDKAHALEKDPVRTGELGGEIETEDLGPAHYSNKTKGLDPQKEKPDEAEANAPVSAKKDGALKGKSETDDLGAAHYGGKRDRSTAAAPEAEESDNDGLSAAKTAGDSQADYLREQKEKKKRRAENYKAATEAEEERERAKKAELEAERATQATAADEETNEPETTNVVPILREKAKPKPSTDREGKETPALGSPSTDENHAPAVTDTAVVTARLRKKGSSTEAVAYVDDFFDGQIIVRTAAAGVQDGDSVEISLAFDYQKKVKKIEVSGKCVESNNDGEGSTYLTIQLGEYETKMFEQFMQLYQLRQSHVEEFIKQAKGL